MEDPHIIAQCHKDYAALPPHRRPEQAERLAREVLYELSRVTAAVSLHSSSQGFLYTRITSRHPLEELAVRKLARLFPEQLIVVGSKRGTFYSRAKKPHVHYSPTMLDNLLARAWKPAQIMLQQHTIAHT